MSRDTGGTAFPFNELNPHSEEGRALNYQSEGMTLRDHFAGQFCAAMVSTIRNDGDYSRLRAIADAHDLETVSQFFAQEAYKQADAMLLERAK